MRIIELKLKYTITSFVSAELLTTNTFLSREIDEIREISLHIGNTETQIGEIFEIKENITSTKEDNIIKLNLHGDFSNFKRIGYRMNGGIIEIFGDCGLYTGELMEKGKIVVHGNANSWLGLKMINGEIEVYGDAADFVGGSYRGEIKGMTGGKIIIHGSVGNEIGYGMKGGLITVDGNAGDLTGLHMARGTILIKRDCGRRCGAFMKNGAIIIMGNSENILPSFKFKEEIEEFKNEHVSIKGPFLVYTGDLTENGEGLLMVKKHI